MGKYSAAAVAPPGKFCEQTEMKAIITRILGHSKVEHKELSNSHLSVIYHAPVESPLCNVTQALPHNT
jgi:hypothetical protein